MFLCLSRSRGVLEKNCRFYPTSQFSQLIVWNSDSKLSSESREGILKTKEGVLHFRPGRKELSRKNVLHYSETTSTHEKSTKINMLCKSFKSLPSNFPTKISENNGTTKVLVEGPPQAVPNSDRPGFSIAHSHLGRSQNSGFQIWYGE